MKLKEWRWLEGYEQSKLAELLKCSQPEISRIEKGDHRSLNVRARFKTLYGNVVNDIEEFKFKKRSN